MRILFFVSTVIFWAQLACAMDAATIELIEAASANNADRVIAALECGANANLTGDHGDSLLMHAAYRGHIDVCSALITACANIHQKDNLGQTALSLALDLNRKAVIALLVKSGADINMPNEKGYTPLMHVTQIMSVLYFSTPKDGVPPHWPSLEKMQFLLECGADPNVQRRKTLKTALMYAIQAGEEARCALLLKYGASIGLKNKKGQTALILAARYGEERMCEMLVNHQAALDRSMITFLCCLKHSQDPSARFLYDKLRRDILSPYLKQFSLQLLLNARDRTFWPAYGHLQLEFMNPYPKMQVIEGTEEKTEKKKMGKKNKKCVIQ